MKCLVFKIALLFPFLLSGQVRLQNLSLQTPDSNVLYIGVDNNIKILNVRKPSKLNVEIQGGSFKPSKEGLLTVHVINPGESQLDIYAKSGLLYSAPFIVRELPRFKASLGTHFDTTLSISEILENNELNIFMPNCIFKFNAEVVSFKVSFSSNSNQRDTSYYVHGNKLSSPEIELIKSLKSGSRIIFENIRFVGPEDVCGLRFYINIK